MSHFKEIYHIPMLKRFTHDSLGRSETYTVPSFELTGAVGRWHCQRVAAKWGVEHQRSELLMFFLVCVFLFQVMKNTTNYTETDLGQSLILPQDWNRMHVESFSFQSIPSDDFLHFLKFVPNQIWEKLIASQWFMINKRYQKFNNFAHHFALENVISVLSFHWSLCWSWPPVVILCQAWAMQEGEHLCTSRSIDSWNDGFQLDCEAGLKPPSRFQTDRNCDELHVCMYVCVCVWCRNEALAWIHTGEP